MKEQKNKRKYSEIRYSEVLNIKGMQDFSFILPLYSSSIISVFSIAFKRQI